MTSESDFLFGLRDLAGHPAARGLVDDAAVLEVGGAKLVLTHDMIVEGVHFLSSDPPEDVAWKLVAVNLSDLSGKGAFPVGALLGYTLAEADEWNRAFLRGLGAALDAFDLALLGGDTVSAPSGGTRSFGLTAIGEVRGPVPSRTGAQAGDGLWVSGSIGDAGAGLRVALGELPSSPNLVQRYRRPRPRLEAGQKLAPMVSAMMDVSDGLLIDAARMAAASDLAVRIELGSVPLSGDCIALTGDDRSARIDAAIAGDDYELLFAAPHASSVEVLHLSEVLGLSFTRIGRFDSGSGLSLFDGDAQLQLPPRIGWEHGPA